MPLDIVPKKPSFSRMLESRAEEIRMKHEAILQRRFLQPQEESVFIHTASSLLMLIFPCVPDCLTGTYYGRFQQGERFERPGDIMWLLGPPCAHHMVDFACFYRGTHALVVRMALLSVLLHIPSEDVFNHYSSGWGGGFQTQCVGCGRVYALGFGWSYHPYPFLPVLPKVACPACLP